MCVVQVPTRGVVVEAHPAGATPIPAQQIGADPAFVEEHVLPHVPDRLPLAPVPARSGDIRSPGLKAYTCFSGYAQARQLARHRAQRHRYRQCFPDLGQRHIGPNRHEGSEPGLVAHESPRAKFRLRPWGE